MYLVCGGQRSGKTAFCVFLARRIAEVNNLQVYSNCSIPGFTLIDSISQVPNNSILLLDEFYNLADSRNYKNFNSTLFFNTLRKRGIVLIANSIRPEMVELRIRQQIQFIVFSKQEETKDGTYFVYRVVDTHSSSYKDLYIPKTDKYFKYLNYDTMEIPDIISMEFNKKK